MSASINESISKVRELLLSPDDQKPALRLVFGAVLREFANIYNELSNSSVFWSVQEHLLPLAGGTVDYLIPGNSIGKVLFVTGSFGSGFPSPIEFTDMSDASNDWWYSYPVVAARPEDYNFGINSTGAKVAFYRKNSSLYVRMPSGYASADTLTITTATGDWSEGVNTNAKAVLSEYHALPEIRAAMNLVDACEWSTDPNTNMAKAQARMSNLMMQEQRVNEQFKLAKKSLTADDVIFRQNSDCYF